MIQIEDAENDYKFSNHVNFSVVKIGNIPWEISSKDVCDLIEPCVKKRKPVQEWVHIPIDRTTGKTKNELFIEVPTLMEAQDICNQLDKVIIKQRAISVSLSSFEELLAAHVGTGIASHFHINPEEATNLIDICRNYKV